MTSDHSGNGDGDGGGEHPVTLTAADIARVVGGELLGEPTVEACGIAPLDRAAAADVSFLAAAKYAALCQHTAAGVVIVTRELASAAATRPARVVVANPHDAILALIPHFHPPPARTPAVHPTARIGPHARLGSAVALAPYAVVGDWAVLGDRVSVGAHAVVGAGVTVGDDTVLHAGTVLYPGAVVGKRVVIHGGACVGSDGFGYRFRDGGHEKVPHVGRAVVEDDVEIGANSTIDRGSIDDTVIGAGTKIDNLVHVAHNVRIGRRCLVMAQVGLAGSVRVEDDVIIAGQAGIGGHQTIGRGARVGGQAGVFGDVPPGETWSGYPARRHAESLRAHAALFRLAGLIRRLERLVERGGAE